MSTTTKSKHNNTFVKIIIVLLTIIASVGIVKYVGQAITIVSTSVKYGTESSQKFGKIVDISNSKINYNIKVESKNGFNEKHTFNFEVSYLEARTLNINDTYEFKTTTPLSPKLYKDLENDFRNTLYLLILCSIISCSAYVILKRTFGDLLFVDFVTTKYKSWCVLSQYLIFITGTVFYISMLMLITLTLLSI